MRIGSGKTSILQAISFAIFGKTINGVSLARVVNNISGKNCFVGFDWKRDGVKYRVERTRKPDTMRFLVGGSEYQESSDETLGVGTQRAIEQAFGMSWLVFQNIIALNTYNDPFLKLEAAKQRAFMEELLDASIISEKAKLLSGVVKTTKDDIKIAQTETQAIQNSNSRISTALRDAEVRSKVWCDQHSFSLTKEIMKFEKLLEVDVDAELQIFDRIAEHEKIQNEINLKLESRIREISFAEESLRHHVSLKPRDFDTRIEEEIKNTHLNNLARINKSIKDVDYDSTKIEGKLLSAYESRDNPSTHNCDRCQQSLEGTLHLDTIMAAIANEITLLEKNLNDNSSQRETLFDKITQENSNFATLETSTKLARKIRENEISEFFEKQNILKEDIIEKKNLLSDVPKTFSCPSSLYRNRDAVIAIKNDIDNVNREISRMENETNPYTIQIRDLENAIQDVNLTLIDDLIIRLKHEEFLLKLLTDRNSFVRQNITQDKLILVNNRLSIYFSKLQLPFVVKIKPDLTIEIFRHGKEYDYGQISRGETNFVNLAVNLAFRETWEDANGGINLLWIDEVLDNGLCANTSAIALRVINALGENNRSVWLVSHREEFFGKTDRRIIVVKENDLSTISEDFT
jgi:DNA repair exonuclease SbcCD ATPase subunit